MFWPAFRAIDLHVYPATLYGHPIAPPLPLRERESRVISTGTYPHSSLPASPSRSYMAREYPSGPTSTHFHTHMYVLSLPLIFAWLAQEV
jgi:hypothetical protein